MTYEEALEIIRTEKECVTRADDCARDCANCKLVMPTDKVLEAYELVDRVLNRKLRKGMTRIYEKALKYLDEHCTASVMPLDVKITISEVLEKQIPKETIETDDWYGDCCPICKRFVGEYGEIYKFCPFCGQALDRGDEE